MLDNQLNDIAKHKKKVSKTAKKSKHKHNYVDCVIFDTKHSYRSYFKSTYCTECGKIGEKKLVTVDIEGSNHKQLLVGEELYKKYKHLVLIEVEDVLKSNYVCLSEVNV